MSLFKNDSFLGDLRHYLMKNKAWWLVPLILVLTLFGGLLIIAQLAPAVSPFVYTFF